MKKEKVMKWISVEDRLPEKNKAVIGCVTDRFTFEGKISVSTVCYFGIASGWESLRDEDFKGKRVTHWMPMPKPPTGEE
jgi:hypothetical protein